MNELLSQYKAHINLPVGTEEVKTISIRLGLGSQHHILGQYYWVHIIDKFGVLGFKMFQNIDEAGFLSG